MHTHTHKHTRIHARTHMHTHTHAHAHTRTHTPHIRTHAHRTRTRPARAHAQHAHALATRVRAGARQAEETDSAIGEMARSPSTRTDASMRQTAPTRAAGCGQAGRTRTATRVLLFSAALASLPTAMRASMAMFCGTSLMALRTLSDGIAA